MQHLAVSLSSFALKHSAGWHAPLMHQWSAIMGPFTQQIRIERLEAHRIIVGVYDPRSVAEFHANSWMLLERLREVLPEIPTHTQVACVWARVGRRHVAHHHKEVVEEQCQLIGLSDSQDAALSAISDPELRSVFGYYWQRCLQVQSRRLVTQGKDIDE